ncbi:MAG TPA: hypothetical protein DCE44_07920, partial [Verrucomicrobiales bacterium]|nr:hypothetical protein [Verrucomicrobiales bacterium]
RVRPTTRVSGRAVNNDSALEQQAETMGSRAADAGQTALTGASHVGDMRLGPAVGRNGGDAPRFLAASAGGVIQRNKRGVKLLGLAKPKLFQFPEPKRERKASAAIERIATQNLAFRFQANNPNSIFAEFTVCGVLLPENLDQKDSKLIGAGQVVNVIGPAAQDMQQYFPSDLKKSIAKIVMQTLLLADQIDYLRETDLTAGNNRVLVEVHYYYNRPPSFAGRWHKDTRGDTMFVNLNYINPESPIPGPEYLVNPHTTEEHARQRRELVPDSFLTDLEFAQDNLDEPTEIGWGMVPTYGVVSFVDELIHHTTPLAGGRKVSAEQLSGDPARGLVAPEERLALSDLASAANNPVYDRLDLESAGLSPETASILLNAFAAENYKSVGIFYLPHRQPLTADGNTSRLTRRMSVSGRDVTDPPPDARRSFFRTWVRSVTAGIGYIT